MINVENGFIYFDIAGIQFKDCSMSLEIDGVTKKYNLGNVVQKDSEMILKCEFPEDNISWEIAIQDNGNEKIITSNIINHGKKPVKLGKAFLLDASIEGFGTAGDFVTVLPWRAFCKQDIYRIDDPEMPELSKVKVQFCNNTRHLALQAAFLTFQRCNTELVVRRSSGGLDSLQAYCDFAGWELEAGYSTDTEVFRILAGENPFAQLENWADMVQNSIKPAIWEDTPLGFSGGAWIDTVNGMEEYDKVAIENLDAINRRLAGFGFKYLWTSMKNFEGSLPGNWLKWNYDRIPCGREKFISAVKEKGFIPGFWTGPFYIASNLKDLIKEFDDAILRSPNGEKMIVRKEWQHGDAGKIPKKDRPCLYALDPSHPKTLKFIRNVFKTYREWGIRYYMVDFLEAGAGNIHSFQYKEHFNKKLVPGPEVYTNFLKAMKKSAGKDTYLLSSSGPNIHNAGMVDGIRTGTDFGEGRAISKESFFYPASYVINNVDFCTGPKSALKSQAASYHTHRKLYINDAGNVLTVDKPIPLSHAQINATIHAFSGGPTTLGDDIRCIGEDRLSLIKKTVPRSSDVGFPVDLFTSPAPSYCKLFLRSISKPWGEYKVLAIYNFDPVPQKVMVSFADIGLERGCNYLVWDFWNEMFMGSKNDSLEVDVRPESVTVLRFVKDCKQPQLLGTDMHIMMGEMEIRNFEYNPDEMKCLFTAERPTGETGTVFLHVPENIYIKNIDGLHIAKDGKSNTLVIAVPLKFKKKQIKKEIEFGWIQKPVDMLKENFA